MKRLLASVLVASLPLSAIAQQPRKTAQDIVRSLVAEHDKNMLIWNAKVKNTQDELKLEKLMEKRPKTKAYGDAVIKVLQGHLDKDWSVKHMAWLLRNHPNLFIPAERANSGKDQDIEHEFMRWFKFHHINSNNAGEFVLSLTYRLNKDPKVQLMKHELAVKVLKKNELNKNIGMASLAQSILTPEKQGDLDVRNSKLRMIKTAFVHAYDVKIDDKIVGNLIEEELYHLNKIGVYCPMPEIKGDDSSGLAHTLSQHRGKVALVVFWSGQDAMTSNAIIDRIKKLKTANKKGGFEVLGVTSDPVALIRKKRAEGRVDWRNFMDETGSIHKTLRVSSSPYCYIVDAKGIIRHKGPFGNLNEYVVLSQLLGIKP